MGKGTSLKSGGDGRATEGRPKVSVCIATYNGEKFVARQLQTILRQLGPGDEVVVSDDSSSDDTVGVIERLADERIRIFPSQKFRSPVYNFENALKESTGDIIFMSDQDDEWVDGWVNAALDELRSVSMLVCNSYMIDADGNRLNRDVDSARIGTRKQGFFYNLRQNGYIGCCLAFRREVLEVALPFPPKLPWHDWWLGMVAETFFNAKFLQTKFIRYRRHDMNASLTGEKSRTTLGKKISMRVQIISGLVRRAVEQKLR